MTLACLLMQSIHDAVKKSRKSLKVTGKNYYNVQEMLPLEFFFFDSKWKLDSTWKLNSKCNLGKV